ncbi:MAG: lysophospholipid acyltransferase family protein [Byssovorax sp.]
MAPSTSLLQKIASSALGVDFLGGLASQARATLIGEHHLPRRGGALLVGNHALGGLDAFPLTALLIVHTGRVPRFLGERNLWRIPGLPTLLAAAGAIPGDPDAAVDLLVGGELVCVYPGGIDDSFKLSSEAYTLKWGARAGFARVAMRAGVPIVPVAATGVDELFEVNRREPWIGRWFGGSARYDVPVPANLLPRRIPLTYHLLEPIATDGDPADEAAVERVRSATFDAMQSVLAPYRARLGVA